MAARHTIQEPGNAELQSRHSEMSLSEGLQVQWAHSGLSGTVLSSHMWAEDLGYWNSGIETPRRSAPPYWQLSSPNLNTQIHFEAEGSGPQLCLPPSWKSALQEAGNMDKSEAFMGTHGWICDWPGTLREGTKPNTTLQGRGSPIRKSADKILNECWQWI